MSLNLTFKMAASVLVLIHHFWKTKFTIYCLHSRVYISYTHV